MNQETGALQIAVLDTGGQYCHLITRRIRELGVYAEVRPSETAAEDLAGVRGIVISGGPNSVYEPGSPTVDPKIFAMPRLTPILGICYGQQLMAHLLGGKVRRGERGEYGLAYLEPVRPEGPLAGVTQRQRVWMSHRDTVEAPPEGFFVLARTGTCPVAAMGDPDRRLYGVQFHPEVVHTEQGTRMIRNFLYEVCGCTSDWEPRHQVAALEERIRATAGDRNVFFFVSGGVDSTVAYTLCLRALGRHRVQGTYVDTGLMREGETEFVSSVFESLSSGDFSVESAADRFLGALAGVRDPERKRHIIGQQFVAVQERILESGHYLDGHWILGQGTIYPDTIESGGTAKADVIKTHHNRVEGIQQLIDAGRIVEPLASFYKDEVREIGRVLGLPAELLERHPFPGPGLAIRCLCSEADQEARRLEEGWILPVNSVGVQGDSRSYRPVLALEGPTEEASRLQEKATELINRIDEINRVVWLAGSRDAKSTMRVFRSELSATRLDRLRRADAVVRRLSHESGFDRKVWQFPVVLIPVGAGAARDSVVLRPVDSVDGMTASSVLMEPVLLGQIVSSLLEIEGVWGVYYDLTHKPPATIEWE